MLKRQIERLIQLDYYINIKCTGNAKELSLKLGISESTLFILLQMAKEYGAEIVYNPYRRTYEYNSPVEFVFGFKKKLNA